MIKVVTIIGARPQFIKAATVSRLINQRDDITEILVHTGQHYDQNMSDVFFSELEIPQPAYHLGIGSNTHGAQTGQMLAAIEEVLLKEKPDWVLIYGDTNSTLAGALAAVKLHIPVAHVEAGLRSYNRKMPEEINRLMADHISSILFAPTQAAVENLVKEGISDQRVKNVGDVMYDAALYYAEKAATHSQILEQLQLQNKYYLLATIHRAENTDDPQRLNAIFQALCQLGETQTVILPLHPRTQAALQKHNLLAQIKTKLQVIDPVGFLDMVMLEKHARLIVTDSGGVQKEAFFYQVPCITLRDETEWVELVKLGWNKVVPPTDANSIYQQCLAAINTIKGQHAYPYGNGHAAQQIIEALL